MSDFDSGFTIGFVIGIVLASIIWCVLYCGHEQTLNAEWKQKVLQHNAAVYKIVNEKTGKTELVWKDEVLIPTSYEPVEVR